MAALSHRLIDARVLSANQVQSMDEVIDAGAFNFLHIQVRVLSAGTGGNLIFQHSATKEPDGFLDLSSGSQALNASGNFYITIPGFLRYLRWRTDGSVAGGPVVIADAVIKE